MLFTWSTPCTFGTIVYIRYHSVRQHSNAAAHAVAALPARHLPTQAPELGISHSTSKILHSKMVTSFTH
ncbi:hypothetical protein F441_02528 [Phytophthora nicotianae CJ01A1]|uniref:Uncharacterized protein n=2 Tax=Phytophthora nicotianae TaxID=4792 RepID=W2XP64_PHYNI|nr:hypothetical protein L914_02455 [Phytophthora nicotianae]ETP24486.1 hypothetical protein F441_02528 [Phytophthora nicotianae CJ01A1]